MASRSETKEKKRDPLLFPRLGFGLGLRSEHAHDVLQGRSTQTQWFEVISENYMAAGGRPLHTLEKVRADYPVVLHGVSLSIGSADPLNEAYLGRLAALCSRIEPALVSDHLCWTGVNGENLHDLLPLPYTRDTVSHVVERVLKVQDRLKRRLVLENVSSYLTYSHSEMTEWEFLTEVATRADCGLLLDINNVYVSSVNHGFDPRLFIEGVPRERVAQFHLAGHSVHETGDGRSYLIDTHDHPVCDEVWALYASALKRFGLVNTMIEWDANLPEYARLEQELAKAKAIAAGMAEQTHESASPQLRLDVPAGRKAASGKPAADGLPLPAR